MEIDFADLETCHTASGLVIVIDVCRAFTTAAFAFGAGARQIYLAGTVAQALDLRARFSRPDSEALAMGEVDGLPVPEFDLWNSPAQVSELDLRGRLLVQRTSSGTQGMLRAAQAEHLLAGSFVVAGATVRAAQRLAPRQVTFVITGGAPEDPRYGLEDRACAEYMAALLRGQSPNPADYLAWEADFRAAHRLDELPEPLRSRFYQDLTLCRQVDRFSFALPVHREGQSPLPIQRDGELLVMEKEES